VSHVPYFARACGVAAAALLMAGAAVGSVTQADQQSRCIAISNKHNLPENAFLGNPTTGCNNLGDGASQFYQGGSIYYGDRVGRAQMVYGAILGKYQALGAQTSLQLYPTTDEANTRYNDGRYNVFEKGTILWRTGTSEAFGMYGTSRESRP